MRILGATWLAILAQRYAQGSVKDVSPAKEVDGNKAGCSRFSLTCVHRISVTDTHIHTQTSTHTIVVLHNILIILASVSTYNLEWKFNFLHHSSV